MIIVKDNDGILEDSVDLVIEMNKYTCGVIFEPSDYTISCINLSGLCIFNDHSEIHDQLFTMDLYDISCPIDRFAGDIKILERFIATNAYSSFVYSTTIIRNRFKLGEPVMSGDDEIWKAYTSLMKNNKLNIDGIIADAIAGGKTVNTRVYQ